MANASDRPHWFPLFRYLWAAPHQPLFLAAALCAVGAVAWWPLAGALLPAGGHGDPVLWHVHEMLFGFVGAAVGAYLLTAQPSWTQDAPVHGLALAGLVGMWGLARLAAAFTLYLPMGVVPLPGSGYFLLLGWFLFRPIARAKAWRKLGFCAVLVILAAMDGVFLIQMASGNRSDCLTIARLAVMAIVLLMAVIGSKAIAGFTANWLRMRGVTGDLPRPMWPILAVVFLATAMGCQGAGWQQASALCLCAAALMLFWPMRKWRSYAVRSDPLLLGLHLAYLWLPAGIGLMGAARLFSLPASETDLMHILTIGAMGGMIMAFVGRATALRHDGSLRARRGFTIGYALIWLAVLARLWDPLTLLSAALWCLGWIVCIAGLVASFSLPPSRPVFSGRRAPPPILLSSQGPCP